MSDTLVKHTVILKEAGRFVTYPVPDIASGEGLISRRLGVNKSQPLRTLRATPTERVYTIPRGTHATLRIQHVG